MTNSVPTGSIADVRGLRPGTTSVQHLKVNLAAAHIALTRDEVDAITALAPEAH